MAGRRRALDLRDDLVGGDGSLGAAGPRNDAVGAMERAAVLDLDEGARSIDVGPISKSSSTEPSSASGSNAAEARPTVGSARPTSRSTPESVGIGRPSASSSRPPARSAAGPSIRCRTGGQRIGRRQRLRIDRDRAAGDEDLRVRVRPAGPPNGLARLASAIDVTVQVLTTTRSAASRRPPARRRGPRRRGSRGPPGTAASWDEGPSRRPCPGSSDRTTSPGCRRWRRHVGRMTSRRPIRSTGKWLFHASAQSASRTIRGLSSPIGRSPNAWRWPSAVVASAMAGSTRAGSRPGRYARTMAGLVGSTTAPRPSSVSPKPGSTLVPPGAKRVRISLTASTASMSAATDSSTQTPDPSAAKSRLARPRSTRRRRRALEDRPAARPRQPRASFHPIEDPAGRQHGLARLGGQLLEQLALPLRQLGRHVDVDDDVEVAARPGPAQMRHAAAAQPDLGAGLGARPDLHLLVALDRGIRTRVPSAAWAIESCSSW
jgi:hypothetical protein